MSNLGIENFPAYHWTFPEVRMTAIKWLSFLFKNPTNLNLLGIEEIRRILNEDVEVFLRRERLFRIKLKVMNVLEDLIPFDVEYRTSLIGFLTNVIVPEIPYTKKELDSIFCHIP